jgi:Histone methylation protein DOT1
VSSDFPKQFWRGLRSWWREQSAALGTRGAASLLLAELWGFACDSTPERRRSRYGDMEYDWDHRVDTTSGTVGWKDRLLGTFHSAYQPTAPAAFREMMAALPINFPDFCFIDLGSGKGRTLLMAAEYPFQKIMGVELIAGLHRAAEQNIAKFGAKRSAEGSSRETADPQVESLTPVDSGARIEVLCMDVCDFVFPITPLVVYMFNPLPESGLRRVIGNLEGSWKKTPRPIWIVYHNPLLANVLEEFRYLTRVSTGNAYQVLQFASSD